MADFSGNMYLYKTSYVLLLEESKPLVAKYALQDIITAQDEILEEIDTCE